MGLLKFRLFSLAVPLLLAFINRRRGLGEHLKALGPHLLGIQLFGYPRPFLVRLEDGKLKSAGGGGEPEVVFKGTLGAFLNIVTGKTDPDAAFFERRIVIEGSTPLSLLLKNALDRYALR